MGKSFRNEVTLLDGAIRLYQRTDQGTGYQSDSWYAYLKVPGHKGIRRSLKTKDRLQAQQLAESLYFDLSQKAKRGLTLKTKRFSDTARAYLRDYEKNVERESDFPKHQQEYKADLFRNKKRITEKYLLKYFDNKNLQDITDSDIEDYIEWRNTYWIDGDGSEQKYIEYKRNGKTISRPKRKAEKTKPDYSTLNKELTVIRDIFEFARKQKLIDAASIPVIKNIRKPKNHHPKKPGLKPKEFIHLMQTTLKTIASQTNPKHKRHQKLIFLYMWFLASTGIRVSEAKNLLISDCEIINKHHDLLDMVPAYQHQTLIEETDGNPGTIEKEYLIIFVRAKGTHRELVGLDESKDVYRNLIKFHKENAARNGWRYSEDLPLFMNEYGKPVKDFKKGIDAAFERAGLLYDKAGIKRTAGAFRKYYITQALLNGVNVAELAKQCGNSVAVISEYYNEISPTDTPEKFQFDVFI